MGLIKSSHPPFTFTDEQYYGLAGASLSATGISLLASFASLVVHFLLLWYDHHRPDNENYSTGLESKPLINTSSIVIKDNTSGADKYNLKAIQHNRMTRHFDTSPIMTTHHGRHGFLKKSSSAGAMNRVSLRLIVLACICYSIYSVTQIVIIFITEKVLACRVLAYFNVCFDVAGSLCLGLVGFNLVLVFVANVKHPERFEKYYYASAVLVCILVLIPPLVLKAGRTIDKNDSCWYHFFFEGRAANPFNWLYYYSWLLFASILATVSSIIAICKLLLEKNNFAHTLNMLNREEASCYPRPTMYPIQSSASTRLHQNTNHTITTTTTQPQSCSKGNADKSSDLFRRVAIRCVCYALVPVLCKSWGIGIEIAVTSGILVNYPILVIDRFMACIMGFFVSCIYFSDPSVRMVWQDMMIDYKKRYVDQFYYVDITKIIQLEKTPNNNSCSIYDARRQHHQEERAIQRTRKKGEESVTYYAIMNFNLSITKKRTNSTYISDQVYIPDFALRRPIKYHPPFHCREEVISDSRSNHDWLNCILLPIHCMQRKEGNHKWVPMRRIDISLCHSKNDRTHSTDSQQSVSGIISGHHSDSANQMIDKNTALNDYKKDKSRIFEPYSHPKLAKCVYWFLVYLLFYRPPYYHRQKRIFEKRKEKSRQQQQHINSDTFPIDSSSEVSFSCININTDSDDDDDDDNIGVNVENITTNASNNESDKQSSHNNSIQNNALLGMKEESVPLSSSSNSLPVQHNFRLSDSPIANSITASIGQTRHSAEAQQQPHPLLLRPGSRNRAMSSSLIKCSQEKGKERSAQEDGLGRRSSSNPLSSVENLSVTASSSRQSPIISIKSIPKRHGKMKKGNSPYTKDNAADKAFLDQKLSLKKPHGSPNYQHTPTIGQLIRSVAPVHSFVSVRRKAAYPFTQAPAARPSSIISGSSSLHSSPVATSLLSSSPSSSSSSSSSSPLPKKEKPQEHTTSGEKRDMFALHQNQRQHYSPPQLPSSHNRLYQVHVLYHDSHRPAYPSRQKSRQSLFVGDGHTQSQGKDDDENECPYCNSQYNDVNSCDDNGSGSINGSINDSSREIDHEQSYSKNIQQGSDNYDEKMETNDKALPMTCINDYHHSSTYISDQYQHQPLFFAQGGGLSPPSKQHYTFIYCQGERVPTSPSIMAYNDHIDAKTPAKNKACNVQTFSHTDKELLFSGVQTTLMHIKNEIYTSDRTEIDNQQQNAKDRIDMLVGNWDTSSMMYYS